MKTRLLPLPLVLVAALIAVLLLAACGGGGHSVPADAVAVVDSTPITKVQFDQLMATAKGEDQANGQTFPAVGTTSYTQLRDQAVSYLVQAAELEQEAQSLGVTITQKDIDTRFTQIEQQYYGGSKKKFIAGLKKSGLTLAQFTRLQRVQLLAQRVNDKVTAKVMVTSADTKSYYDAHKSTYTVPKTREVRHILVKTKKLADELETKLKNGASFTSLVKKYSKDPSTVSQGGKLCVAHGGTTGKCVQTVSEFDKASFSLKTHAISQPVHSQYGWHIIQALTDVKPAHTQTYTEVAAQIKANLLQTKKNAAWQSWLDKVQKDFKGKVAYQTGYTPATTTTTATTVPATTASTTTG